MASTKYILALDQGTTSSRAIVFGHDGRAVAQKQREFRQILPAPGIVEHDAEEIWESQLAVAREAIAAAKITADDIAAIGVTNQRETAILWERDTGRPVANAIVWQSRVTAPICEELKAAGLEPTFRQKTGLVVDAYFSGTKIKHLLDQHRLHERAAAGEILFGTVDSFLLWRLTGKHVTDVSNASRTLVFNIHTLDWDDELLQILGIPRKMLPDVRPSSEVYGMTKKEWFGREIPVAGCAGDQQAATFGQACFEVGSAKNTYGTGCFMLLNTGQRLVPSKHNLLTRLADKWRHDVLPGRVGVHRGCGRAVAARRVEDWPNLAGDRQARHDSSGCRRRGDRAGFCRSGGAALGPACTRGNFRHHARHDGGSFGQGGD
jgi:glycerol kinase